MKKIEIKLPFTIDDFTYYDCYVDDKNHCYKYLYRCKCGECGERRKSLLYSNKSKCNHIRPGDKFGRLTVVKLDDVAIRKDPKHRKVWLCQCDCGNPKLKSVSQTHLKDGHTQSCGCYREEHRPLNNKKYNKYEKCGDYYKVYTENFDSYGRNYFYIDIDDYEKVSKEYWSFDSNGYLLSGRNRVMLHRLIMDVIDKDLSVLIDHIHGDKTRNDNRSSNLRIVTPSQNCQNTKLKSNKNSGVTGVSKARNKWHSRIVLNGEIILLGNFDTKEEAIAARKAAENKYFGEYSYDNSQKL